jgi:archaemetzincin
MRTYRLLAVGEIAEGRLQGLRSGVAGALGATCEIDPGRIDPAFAFHPERMQYHSTEILARLAAGSNGDMRVLGVTAVDLYIPILTFVFGEAQVGGRCALVSTKRLEQEFYGLPGDEALLRARLLKEALHEIGHTLGLRHCDDRRCAMASSHAVEWIDLKDAALCPGCLSLGARTIA